MDKSGMRVAHPSMLIESTKNAFEASTFTINIKSNINATVNIIKFNKSAMIEIEPDIWCMTNFGYEKKFFRYKEEYKDLIKCFIETVGTSEQQDTMERLENSGIELAIDIATDFIEKTKNKSSVLYDICMASFEYELNFNSYRASRFGESNICLMENQGKYENQLIRWDEELKGYKISQATFYTGQDSSPLPI